MTRLALTGAALAILAFSVRPVAAQAPDTLPPQLVERAEPFVPSQDVQATRQQLSDVLGELPPSVRGVIRLDPSMMDNEAFMADYPRLGAFLAQHPEVRRDPAFFFGSGQPYVIDRDRSAVEGVMSYLAPMTGLVIFFLVVGWLLGQLVSYRRWLRRTRMQVEMHGKILDRMQSNEELIRYIETPAGRDLMSFAAAAPGDAGNAATVEAPVGRILWSLQIGVVLAALGLGLLSVQGRVSPDEAMAFGVLGVIVSAVGLGAVASAAIAWVISMRLGILPTRRPAGPESHA